MTVKPKERGAVTTCLCCGLPKPIYMDWPTAQQVCDECKAHHNRDQELIKRLHRDWWMAHDKAQTSNYSQIVSGLRTELRAANDKTDDAESRLVQMRALVVKHFEGAPVGTLQTWLRDGIVINAHGARDSAFRRRDQAMRALWRLDKLHNDDETPGTCKCGPRTEKCSAWKVLADEVEDLDRWEQDQLTRMEDGREHGLPREHPEVRRRSSLSYGY
jgi:hypothetical protein